MTEGFRNRGIGGVIYTAKADVGTAGGHEDLDIDVHSSIDGAREKILIHTQIAQIHLKQSLSSLLGTGSYEGGGLEKAEELCREALRLSTSIEEKFGGASWYDRHVGADIRVGLSTLLAIDGRIGEAREFLTDAISTFDRMGHKKCGVKARKILRSLGEQGLR